MKLNKNAAYVLLHLLNGNTTAAKISQQMPDVNIRSVQRALIQLSGQGMVIRKGPNNNPIYSVNYKKLLMADIADRLLEEEKRPTSHFNWELITWLKKLPKQQLEPLFTDYTAGLEQLISPEKISAKELEYLTVELSWKSSALEGNTYTLLDTQLLLIEGVKPKNKTEFETQMILNHKDTIAFIIEHEELFSGNIPFKAVEELHRIIGRNLGIGGRIRRRLVKIGASNYVPLANPHQLKEAAELVLGVINRATNPFIKALLALALIPYLQLFEDGNKRTGRMLANAILIHSVGKGFSLRKTEVKPLALAYLSFYEFNSMRPLSKILHDELV